ncbi:conserved uncharacterized protein, putative involvement in regulation of phenolics degradation [Desulfosarcina variabilis str. Montpellier]|uniref:SphA family protein n=1 Tax=Desulfosarcina variabilis TaxID=2300 RepID=UPI003AFA30D3
MSNRTKWIFVVLSCLGLSLGNINASEAATSGNHYVPGGESTALAASAPPPGFHYKIYNTFYNSTTLTDDNGEDLGVGFDLDVFCNLHRFVHVTKKKILGADYLYDVVVPILDKDLSIDALGVSDSRSLSVGDILIEPILLAWHKPRWDAVAGLGVWMPTGEYDADKPASPGLGYWSGMLTLGGTYFFDEKRSWSFSVLTRTLIHTEQDDTEVTPGSEFIAEYGIGKDIPVNDKFLVRPAVVGFGYWQIEDDSDDGPGTVADERKELYGLGAEINYFWLPQLFQVNLRVVREFDAKNTAEGSQFVVTFTKSW